MDIVIDLIIEVIFEVFAEGFISLWLWIFPGKYITEKGKIVTKVIGAIFSLTFLVALVAGIFLLGSSQGRSYLGWLLISLSIIYVLAGITLKIIFCIKK